MRSVLSRQTLRRLFAASIALPLLAAAGGIWIGSERMLRPAWYRHPRAPQTPPHSPDLPLLDVDFPNGRGGRLRGWYVPAAGTARLPVIAVHGAGGDRTNFLPQARWLRAAGHPVLLFDLGEHGLSDGSGRGLGFGQRERGDIVAALDFLARSDGRAHAAVIGVSMGAASALLAAAAEPRIAAVIADASWARLEDVMRFFARQMPYLPDLLIPQVKTLAYLRIGARDAREPLDVIERIAPRPLLLMHGSADSVVPARESRRLFERAREPKRLWILDGGEHARLHEQAPELYRRLVLDFLARVPDAAPVTLSAHPPSQSEDDR